MKINTSKTFLSMLLLLIALAVQAQPYVPSAENLKSRQLFQDMRFGMFIHWGPFSIPGKGEWVMNNLNIKAEHYTGLQGRFNPTLFNPALYVSTAKNAGMKYITLITRHHDGFSMFDTKYSDFNIMHTPYKKDIVKMFADECHKQNVKLFLYYSLLDWRRTDYSYWTGRTGQGTGRTTRGKWEDYIAFMKNQLTELLTHYGKIDGIWFDGYWDQVKDGSKTADVDWHIREIYDLIHRLQPQCLVGNNHHLQPLPGEDFQMFEKDLPGGNTTGFGGAAVSALPLETCETMNDSWGYNSSDKKYKSSTQLIRYIVNAAGDNANFLLNIGPMPSGQIQPQFTDTLRKIGVWMKKHGQTIYGTSGQVISRQGWGTITRNNKTLYVHILKMPKENQIVIPGLKQAIKTAMLFDGKSTIKFQQQPKGMAIYLDVVKADAVDTIVELQLL